MPAGPSPLSAKRSWGRWLTFFRTIASIWPFVANVVKVFAQIPSQEAVDILTSNLVRADPLVKYHLVKALNKLHTNYPRLRFPREKVDASLIEETRSYYAAVQILQAQRKAARSNASDQLLQTAIIEKQDENLELIFRLLGLRYPPKDMLTLTEPS